jgi:hypothetical protein
MALPERVRVKLSSEAAEAISLTRVVVQEMPFHELIDVLLGIAGKDSARVQELLLRGSVVSGASRYRWDGWAVGAEELADALRAFPDPEPQRTFVPDACVRAVLHTSRASLDIPREAAAKKGLLRRTSFWDRLLSVIMAAAPAYRTYSYRDRADVYGARLDDAANASIREAAPLIRYATLRDRVAAQTFDTIDLLTRRDVSAIRPR